MVRAFDLDDVFPDDRDSSGSLPRRQAAGSSQGLAVTLIADYTLRARAWLPSAAIVDLLGEFEVPTGAARATISRLARRGVLEGSRQGRYSSYRLTKDATTDLWNGGGTVVAFTMHPDSWDGSWTVITFSIPEAQSTRRRGLRTELRWRGFAPLYDAVWVSPHPLVGWRRADLAQLAFGAMTVFQAQHVQLETQADFNPIYAWDLPAISLQYETFIRRWSRLLPRISAGTVTGAAAVRARTEVMDTYRRFPVLDPLLPIDLLPPGWPRARARETCVAVYDGLAQPAQEYVRSVVARYSEESPTDIRAHTIAGMTKA